MALCFKKKKGGGETLCPSELCKLQTSIEAQRSKLYISNAKWTLLSTQPHTSTQRDENMKLRVRGAHKVQLEQEIETSASMDNK